MNKILSDDPRIAILSGSSCQEISAKIAEFLGKQLVSCKTEKFSNGDPDVLIQETVRGKTVFVVQTSMVGDTGQSLSETILIADALKRASCEQRYLVQLMFPMARQDRREPDLKTGKQKRRPISAKAVADVYEKVCQFKGLITLHLHSAQIEGFFDTCVVDNINPSKIFIEYLQKEGIINGRKDVMLLAPDAGASNSVSLLSDILNLPPYGIIDKRRSKPGESEPINIIGNVNGMKCIIWDDMVDTGGTAVKGAKKAIENGAKEVLLVATHPVLSGEATKNLLNSPFSKVIFLDTLPLPEALKNDNRFVQLSVAPMLADIIANVYNDESLEEVVRMNTQELLAVAEH